MAMINYNTKTIEQFHHFNFTKSRILLVEGAMGVGKTEYCAKVLSDSRVLRADNKSKLFYHNGYNRLDIMYIKNISDIARFPDAPEKSIAYRGGYIESESIYVVQDTADIEKAFSDDTTSGTIILDEPCFYDEEAIDIILEEMEKRNGIIIFTSLLYNFKKEFFNDVAKKLLDVAHDVVRITGYCNHPECTEHSTYSYRYYKLQNKQEVSAPYFDPTVMVGGTKEASSIYPSYCIRCPKHHHINGKEYVNDILFRFSKEELIEELSHVKNNLKMSLLYDFYKTHYEEDEMAFGVLKLNYLAERILLFLYEKHKISKQGTQILIDSLQLDSTYISSINLSVTM